MGSCGKHVPITNAESCGTFSSAFPVYPKYRRAPSKRVNIPYAKGSVKYSVAGMLTYPAVYIIGKMFIGMGCERVFAIPCRVERQHFLCLKKKFTHNFSPNGCSEERQVT